MGKDGLIKGSFSEEPQHLKLHPRYQNKAEEMADNLNDLDLFIRLSFFCKRMKRVNLPKFPYLWSIYKKIEGLIKTMHL